MMITRGQVLEKLKQAKTREEREEIKKRYYPVLYGTTIKLVLEQRNENN